MGTFNLNAPFLGSPVQSAIGSQRLDRNPNVANARGTFWLGNAIGPANAARCNLGSAWRARLANA
eukprot:5301686-Lingulodinium_polyedra.AAC.1